MFRVIVASLGLLFAATQAFAQGEAYPSRPVQLIVPFPPGGATDIIARILGQQLGERLGKQVVVDNRPGATGGIGAQMVAKARPDGHTLLMAALTNYTINATLLRPTLQFDIQKDFAPVAIVATVPLLLSVHPSVPATDLRQFVAYAKANPEKLTYASSGNGSTEHLAGELLKAMAGIQMLHIPYKGGAPAMNDLVSGQVMSIVGTTPAALPHIQAGKLRALAVAMPARVPSLPDVPTSGEAGLPGFEVASIMGILAPTGTPAAIVARLNGELGAILKLDDVQAKLAVHGAVATHTTSQAATQRIDQDVAKWAKVIATADIKAE